MKSGESVFHPKSAEAKTAIVDALAKHYLFSKLSDEDKSNIANSMSCEPFDKGEKVVVQGEVGDKCYIVEKGQLDINQSDGKGSGKGAKLGTLGPGDTFGELALLFDAPRAASITATSSLTLWCVTRSIFREIVARILGEVASHELKLTRLLCELCLSLISAYFLEESKLKPY